MSKKHNKPTADQGQVESSDFAPARIAELADAIVEHRRHYEQGRPRISDAAFDALEDQLRKLSPGHPALAMVGAAVSLAASSAKVRHDKPMLSLDKTYSREDLLDWMGQEAIVGTVKVDGVSLSLIYENARLSLAKTRGNGQFGEDVTDRVAWVAEVPTVLHGEALPPRLEIRGELYCSESNFVRLAQEFADLGLDKPTSPRNIVAGLLGRKTHLQLMRYFSFFAFEVVDADLALGLETEMAMLAWLGERGLALPFPELLSRHQDADAYLARVKTRIEDDEIQLDGAVFAYNRLELHRQLGATAHHPRGKLSFKWQGQTANTEIVEVRWDTSRLGIVTPVAVVAPVVLSGATITNVTLHNAAHVRTFNLKPGDRIEIVRSGEVIPKFLQVIAEGRGQATLPANCPSCGQALVFDEVRLKCSNTAACPAQRLGAILNWISAVQIDDLSEKRLLPLMHAGLVKGIADLYRLRRDDFLTIPLVKDKMADKLAANINKSKQLPLKLFLTGLGIEGCGTTTWDALLGVFSNLEGLLQASAEDIEKIDGFAAKTATQIQQGLQQRRTLIRELIALGVTPIVEPPRQANGPLRGMSLVITGELSQPRATFEKLIKDAGGKVGSSVSGATFAVVTNDPDSDSSKMKKARALGTKILSEAELLQLLQ